MARTMNIDVPTPTATAPTARTRPIPERPAPPARFGGESAGRETFTASRVDGRPLYPSVVLRVRVEGAGGGDGRVLEDARHDRPGHDGDRSLLVKRHRIEGAEHRPPLGRAGPVR